jgi:hypothetical protein
MIPHPALLRRADLPTRGRLVELAKGRDLVTFESRGGTWLRIWSLAQGGTVRIHVSGRLRALYLASLAIALAGTTLAGASDAISVSKDIVPAPFGYEPVTGKYVVAEESPLYVSPFLYPGTVNKTKLKRGAPVNVIAKVRDFDWVLVGQNGVGIGYIPAARVAPAR